MFGCREQTTGVDPFDRLLDQVMTTEQIATPFEWKFTKDDLNGLLERIAAHEDVALTHAAQRHLRIRRRNSAPDH